MLGNMCVWFLGELGFFVDVRGPANKCVDGFTAVAGEKLSAPDDVVSKNQRSTPGCRPILEVTHQNKSNADINWTPVRDTLGQKFSQARL